MPIKTPWKQIIALSYWNNTRKTPLALNLFFDFALKPPGSEEICIKRFSSDRFTRRASMGLKKKSLYSDIHYEFSHTLEPTHTPGFLFRDWVGKLSTS